MRWTCNQLSRSRITCGVASIQITGLFCRIQSLLQGSFAKETYNLKEPTNRSHPICNIRAFDFDRKKPPPPGEFPIYYIPSSRTVCKRNPLEESGTNYSRGSSYTRFLMREHSKQETPPGGGFLSKETCNLNQITGLFFKLLMQQNVHSRCNHSLLHLECHLFNLQSSSQNLY